ncbi:MAG: hypothetical protein QME71_02060 [Dehalococcoidia bacterium]|nr:hypothetical protein [Dehalococcoidia bacterium]
MEIRVEKPLRLDQLTDEVQKALPGEDVDSRIHGLSARFLDDGGRLLLIHTAGADLDAGEEATARQVVDAHVPDSKWGLSADQKALAAILERPAGTLSTAEVEAALRLAARTLRLTEVPLSPPAYDQPV